MIISFFLNLNLYKYLITSKYMTSITDNILQAYTETNYLHPGSIHTIKSIVKVTANDSLIKTNLSKIENVCLIILIDSSLSMTGEKLDIIKMSINYILQNISSECFISLIDFNHTTHVLSKVPLKTTLENVTLLQSMLKKITASGNTDITGALMVGMEQLEQFSETNNIYGEIILMTDGRHNRGISWERANDYLRTIMIKVKFPVHTFSIGEEPNALELIKFSSKSAGGKYAHMESCKEIPQVFGEFIGGIKSRVYTNCVLEFNAYQGTRFVSISGVECFNDELEPGKKYKFYIGSLAAGSSKTFLLTLSIRDTDESFYQDLFTAEFKTEKTKAFATVNINRRLNIGPPSTEIIKEIANAVIRNITTIAIKTAAALADAGHFTEAVDKIKSQINEITKTNDTSKFTMTLIDELKIIQQHVSSQSNYSTGRNNTYSKYSSHLTQDSLSYTTPAQEREGGVVCTYVAANTLLLPDLDNQQ